VDLALSAAGQDAGVNHAAATRRTVLDLLGLESVDRHRPSAVRRRPLAPAGGVPRERVEIDTPDGDTIPCLLLSPERPSGVVVIAVHQHGGDFALGKSEVAGLAGDRANAYGLGLAQRGATVLAPDLLGFEERRRDWSPDEAADERFDALGRVALGGSLQAKHTADVAVLTTWLLEQPQAPATIGIIGHSLGGQVALFSLAADPRVGEGVISCGLGTVASFVRDDVRHNPAWFVPGLIAAGDVPAVAAAIQGQRVLALVGTDDPLFPADGVDAVLAAFAAGACSTHRFDGGHVVPPEAVDLAAGHLLGGR